MDEGLIGFFLFGCERSETVQQKRIDSDCDQLAGWPSCFWAAYSASSSKFLIRRLWYIGKVNLMVRNKLCALSGSRASR